MPIDNPIDNIPAGGGEAAQFSRSRVEQDFLAAFEAIGKPAFFDFMERHFRHESELICNCPPTLLQLGGTHRGLDNIMAALRSFYVEFEVSATSVNDIVVDGAHVVVNYQMALSHVGTGRAGRVSGLNHYVLDADRMIAKCSIFLDNASLAVIGDLLDSFTQAVRGIEEARRRPSGGDEQGSPPSREPV